MNHSDISRIMDPYKNNPVSARPTRAAKARCMQNLTNILRAERSYDLDVSRERASQRLAAENDEQRERRILQGVNENWPYVVFGTFEIRNKEVENHYKTHLPLGSLQKIRN